MSRILLVEDDEAVRAFVSRALQIDGHEVEIAENGEDGLEIVREQDGAFDLVLSDIKMPCMDGIEMTRQISQGWPGLKILLMTGYADQRERAGGLDKLVHDIVAKPFSLSEIRTSVVDALEETGADEYRGAYLVN